MEDINNPKEEAIFVLNSLQDYNDSIEFISGRMVELFEQHDRDVNKMGFVKKQILEEKQVQEKVKSMILFLRDHLNLDLAESEVRFKQDLKERTSRALKESLIKGADNPGMTRFSIFLAKYGQGIFFLIVLVLLWTVTSFAPARRMGFGWDYDHEFSGTDTFGFWGGFGHGFRVFAAFLVLLFGNDYPISYTATYTTGFTYWVGFVLGVLLFMHIYNVLKSMLTKGE